MVNWDTQNRGQNRENEDSYFGDKTDYDGKSCSDFHQIAGRGIEDVESLTMLHGMEMNEMDEDDDGQ